MYAYNTYASRGSNPPANVVTRIGTQVIVNGSVMHFTFPEQAELYELIMNGKVWYKSVDFARSISMARNPSSRQMICVNKLIKETNDFHNGVKTVQPTNTLTVDFSKVMDMFRNAKQHLKRPKITLLLDVANPNGQKVRFTLDKFGTYMNMYGSEWGVNYGKIDVTTGQVFLRNDGRNNQQALMKLLGEFCAEPRKTAILHGKLTGNCCYCSMPLSDPRSLLVGYGPYCADHWHLPWGENPKFTSEGEWIGINPVASAEDPTPEEDQ